MHKVLEKMYKVTGVYKYIFVSFILSLIFSVSDNFMSFFSVDLDTIFEFILIMTPFLITFRITAKPLITKFYNFKSDLYEVFLMYFNNMVKFTFLVFLLGVFNFDIKIPSELKDSLLILRESIYIFTFLFQLMLLTLIVRLSILSSKK